jgi:hypothetical protein
MSFSQEFLEKHQIISTQIALEVDSVPVVYVIRLKDQWRRVRWTFSINPLLDGDLKEKLYQYHYQRYDLEVPWQILIEFLEGSTAAVDFAD